MERGPHPSLLEQRGQEPCEVHRCRLQCRYERTDDHERHHYERDLQVRTVLTHIVHTHIVLTL